MPPTGDVPAWMDPGTYYGGRTFFSGWVVIKKGWVGWAAAEYDVGGSTVIMRGERPGRFVGVGWRWDLSWDSGCFGLGCGAYWMELVLGTSLLGGQRSVRPVWWHVLGASGASRR